MTEPQQDPAQPGQANGQAQIGQAQIGQAQIGAGPVGHAQLPAAHTDAARAALTCLPTGAAVTLAPGTLGAVGELGRTLTVEALVVGSPTYAVRVVVREDLLLAAAGAAGLAAPDRAQLEPALAAAAAVLGPGTPSPLPAGHAPEAGPDAPVHLFVASGETAGYVLVQEADAASPSRPADLADLAPRLHRIKDVELGLAVEIGRARLAVRDIMGLEPGQVIELDRSAGAPADVLVNGRLVARGEVVVLENDYAVRITRILDPSQAV
ncbi:flagellar motor switch protein FliN [Sinomonas halotolerans]|uniref:Flagellar motor switch protein FliN n=1 Tax=Sinomonas halotolerans TaxID=1644133 RepID=A0ABU9WYR3_9MICC